jgi:eukaryotic-like serine/threonine-protein kinase
MPQTTFTKEDAINILSACGYSVDNLEYLDRGGQKTVFTCQINDNKYALKFTDVTKISVDDSTEEDSESKNANNVIVSRAKREIEIMTKVDTPHLVKLGPIGLNVTDYKKKTILFFSEEYIDGTDLSKVLKLNDSLSFKQTIDLAIDIATAIEHLSSINMVHRDIKPQNIMLNKNGQFVLLDTGIAFDMQGETLTAAFHIVGTKIYMSPEQLNGLRRDLDFRSDLFLLGIVMYESVTGIHPFYKPGEQTLQIFANIATLSAESPKNIVLDMPKKLERIIMRLLAKEPHLRYKSCEQLIKQLEKAKEEL